MQPHLCIPLASVATKCMDASNNKCMDTTNIREKAAKDDIYANPAFGEIWFPAIYKNSTHRDGAIYENMNLRKEWFDVDIADRNESKFDPNEKKKISFSFDVYDVVNICHWLKLIQEGSP